MLRSLVTLSLPLSSLSLSLSPPSHSLSLSHPHTGWGNNNYGQLGLGYSTYSSHQGDDPGEMGDALIPIDFGTNRSVVSLGTGGHAHQCAILEVADGSSTREVKCFGRNFLGQLG